MIVKRQRVIQTRGGFLLSALLHLADRFLNRIEQLLLLRLVVVRPLKLFQPA